jgi:hypothetical protein
MFWTDRWLDGFTVKEIAPLVMERVSRRKKERKTEGAWPMLYPRMPV